MACLSFLRLLAPQLYTNTKQALDFEGRDLSGEKTHELEVSWENAYAIAASAACTVFHNSIARVIGPTPPGTGVIAPAISFALSNSTSPTSLPLEDRVIPTSITVAPGLMWSPVIAPGRPVATMRMSALRVCDPRSVVPVWHSVTVALAVVPLLVSRMDTGRPTSCERPTTTTCAPSTAVPACSNRT